MNPSGWLKPILPQRIDQAEPDASDSSRGTDTMDTATRFRFKWEIQTRDGMAIAQLYGSASIDNVVELQRCVKVIANHQASFFVIDLSELTFISSIGMAALVVIRRSIESRKARLTFTGTRPGVSAQLAAGGLARYAESIQAAA